MASATLVNHASVPLGGRKDATPATSPASSLSLDFPRININRLWEDIQRTAQWGEILNSPGLSRLALSKDDQQVREWFCAEASQLGCEVKVDMMGNIFAILPGCVPGLAPIGMGSHLDSQPLGTWFLFFCD